ncbi:MAG: RNA polymerase sigma factor [Prevotella sp.]|nr:RNA polymerase sigma factor [Prevotella sp.]
METEQQLLQKLRGSDTQARRRLYERFVGQAMTTALRYVSDRQTAEDVVHDAFVKILTSLSGYRHQGEGTLRSWVMRIVANVAIDEVKKHEHLLSTDNLDGVVADDDDDESMEKISSEVLLTMIGRLPAGYRLVLNLYVFEHYSHREISQRLGIAEKSSASQLARARKQLQRMMKEYLTKQQR